LAANRAGRGRTGDMGYDRQGRPVRVEYHWVRYFSAADPKLADVYTAEFWVRQADGDWLYLVRPGEEGFARVAHERLRPMLVRQLGLDPGA
jgi:hypothetical protein